MSAIETIDFKSKSHVDTILSATPIVTPQGSATTLQQPFSLLWLDALHLCNDDDLDENRIWAKKILEAMGFCEHGDSDEDGL